VARNGSRMNIPRCEKVDERNLERRTAWLRQFSLAKTT
jgi:hypothetical protein